MPSTVVISLGSNLGDRRLTLLRAVHQLRRVMSIVRISSVVATDPVDAPADSPRFLNMAVAGHTSMPPQVFMHELLAIEKRLGRRRPAVANAPRVIDLDLIFYSSVRMRTTQLVLPHPRYRQREFVMGPLRELRLPFMV